MMRNRSLATVFVLAMVGSFASAARAESTNDAATTSEMCRKTICQHDIRVTLKTKDGGTYDKTFDVMPGVVQPFGLAILAGQTVNIEADVTGDTLSNFRVVASNTHPEKTLTVRFEQSPNGQMILALGNPFDRPLKFNMGIMPLDRPELMKTSSCPVKDHGQSYEMWPGALFQVVLTKPRFVGSTGKDRTCD
jgi:hypothetical protein